MELGRPIGPITPEDYVKNIAILESWQQRLDHARSVNDMGLAAFEQREREERDLQLQIESQERALSQSRQRLLELRSQSNVLALPSTTQGFSPQQPVASSARIEEISSTINRTYATATTAQPSPQSQIHNWPSGVSSAPVSTQGSFQQANYGRVPYQNFAATVPTNQNGGQHYYRPHVVEQSQPRTQQNHFQSGQNLNFQSAPISTPFVLPGVRMGQAQPMQNSQPSTSYTYTPPVSQTSKTSNLHFASTYQTSHNGLAPTATTTPVNPPGQTSSVIPNTSRAPTKPVAVPVSQTLSGTSSNLTTSNGENPEKSISNIERFRKRVSEWAKNAPQNAYCTANVNGVELFPYKTLSEKGKKVSVMFTDPTTGQYRDITSFELAAILEGTYLPPQISQVNKATPSQNTPTSISQTLNASGPAQTPSTSVTPTPNLPKAKDTTPNTLAQSATVHRTPSQANKSTIARDLLRALGKPSGVLPPLNLQPSKVPTPSPNPNGLTVSASPNVIPPGSLTSAQPSAKVIPTEQPAVGSHIPPSIIPSSNAHSVNALPTSVSGQKELDVIVIDDSEPGTPAEVVDRADKRVGSPMVEETEPFEPGTSRRVDSPIIEDSEPGTTDRVGSPIIEDFEPEPDRLCDSRIVENSIDSGTPVRAKTFHEAIRNEATASGSSKLLDSPTRVSLDHRTSSPSPRERTPLFLPSPEPSSPPFVSQSPSEVPAFNRQRTRLTIDYVAVPPAPDYVKEDQASRRRPKRRRIETEDNLFNEDHENAQSSLAALVQEAYAIPSHRSTPERGQRDAAEEAVIKDATTRLQTLPCKWQCCDAVMNSVARLERHLKEHVENVDDCEVVNCLWQDCGRSEISKSGLISHVIQHIHSSLACPYEECGSTFRTSRQLLNHYRENHSNGTLKTSADPSIPSQPIILPECPDVLPSYMVVARHVSHHPMTRERHQLASAAVLKRIMPPTQAVYGLKRSPLKRRDAQKTPPIEDDYDFVAYRASPSCRPSCAVKIGHLPDLRSNEISTMIHNGLTLWKGDAPMVDQEEVTVIAPANEDGVATN